MITTSKVAMSQVQIRENRWLIVPNMAKDKAKVLKVIGAVLQIPLEIG